MLVLRLDVIAGVGHEAPWSEHQSSAWPPAPWTFLTAIVDAWTASPTIALERLRRLCDALAEVPWFALPPTQIDHTNDVSHLDAYAPFDRPNDAVAFVVWDHVTLPGEDGDDLRVLVETEAFCKRLGVLRASVACEMPAVPRHISVRLASASGVGGSTIGRLAAGVGLRGDGLLAALLRQPSRAAADGRSLVQVAYRFPGNFGATALWSQPSRDSPSQPHLERFRLAAIDGCLPRVADTVHVAAIMRSAAMRAYSTSHAGSPAPSVLSGRENGAPARGHGHAFFLPVDLDRDGAIDHLDIWFPVGVEPRVVDALTRIRNIWSNSLSGRFVVTRLDNVPTFATTTWGTSTPFVPPRFMKMSEADAGAIDEWAGEQILRELAHHFHERPDEIVIWNVDHAIIHAGGRRTPFASFAQDRKRKRPHVQAFGATLRFAHPVAGPISLGLEAHYGLGQFAPVFAG